MKNVKCKKMIIDGSKAPAKIGTFKDISLFGSFVFPLTGQYKGGIIAKSLAGQGKCVSKTKAQVDSLSLRTLPIAGATGASVTEDIWEPSDTTVDGQVVQNELYSVKFIQLSSATPEDAVLSPRAEASGNDDLRPRPQTPYLDLPLKKVGLR